MYINKMSLALLQAYVCFGGIANVIITKPLCIMETTIGIVDGPLYISKWK
jgi:hypothetical protein